jgi:uncharacterized membrane protein YfcA
MLWRVMLTIILGAVAGTTGGALGVGPSIIILPGLLALNIITDYKLAVGTTLMAILPPLSILAVMNYYKRQKIDFLIAGTLCISYFIAARYGAIINKETSAKQLKYVTSGIFLIISLYFFWLGVNEKH